LPRAFLAKGATKKAKPHSFPPSNWNEKQYGHSICITTASKSEKLNIFVVFGVLFVVLRRVAALTIASSKRTPFGNQKRNVQERIAKRTANMPRSQEVALSFSMTTKNVGNSPIVSFKN
jgi:hypothetical protein